jgi:lysozyme family protein
MADINQAIQRVIRLEDESLSGKIATDEGGVTKWGIASKYNPGVDVANLTLEQAKKIYAEKYATPFHLQDISDQDVQDRVLDCVVNPGQDEGSKLVQQAINRIRPGSVAEDGCIGPETVSRINALAPDELIPHIRACRVLFYFNDVQKNPDRLPYLFGWLVRACR